MKGLQFDQSQNPNYVLAQQLGAAGRFANVIGYENFGKAPKDDTNNWQPRIGVVWDVRGNAKDLVRAGWGIYTDFGYTNSNVLFAAADASGSRFGTVFTANNTAGLRNPDGSFYRVGQPLTQPRRRRTRRARCRSSASGWTRCSSSRKRGRRRSAGRTS